jgi:hypothetical protein
MAIEERASVCTFDCPDTCSLTVSVDEGRIVKVRGSDAGSYATKSHGTWESSCTDSNAFFIRCAASGLRVPSSSSASRGTQHWTRSMSE